MAGRKSELEPRLVRVGRTLKRLQERRGSLKELEQRLGVSDSYLSNLQTDKRSPELELIYRLAELYGVAPEVLLRPPEPDGVSAVELVARRLELSARDAELLARLIGNRFPGGATVADVTSAWLRYRYDLP